MFAQGRAGGEGLWERFEPGDLIALRALELDVEGMRGTVAALRGSPQPLADGWVDSLRRHRDRLRELVRAARGPAGIGSGGGGGTRRAATAHCPLHGARGRSASAATGAIVESFRALSVECAELISAQPGAVRGGFEAQASPVERTLLARLGRQRAAFSLSATVSLGCPLTSLAHPETVRALLADQRDAGAGALRRLAELGRSGTPGATALAVNLDTSARDGFLSAAVLSSRVTVERNSGAMAVGLFPYGTCMAQLVAGLEGGGGTVTDALSPAALRREAHAELEAIQSAYPLALGAVVRAGVPGCSALEFAEALADADRDCADAIASVIRDSAAGLPRAAELLGRLSRGPGAPDAVLARAGATLRAVRGEDDTMSGGAAGVFPHGSALRRLALDAARAGAPVARVALPAPRLRAVAGANQGAAKAEAPARPLCEPQGWEQGVGRGGGPEGGPGHGDEPNGSCCADGTQWSAPTGDVSAARGQPGRRFGRIPQIPCWNELCDRMHEPSRMYSLCSWCGVFAPGARPCKL
mmetsp:Transcript_69473/g.157035  ORF Transcript_69473/g.157035 Transcript_69473/m.157035 type:complete len:529 (+) Transcript_69473:1274-2860(+)